ncbi:MAG TPA: glycosyltransferase [Gammaproteobacteria bacterium]|nr:glycosyltransferase [Gammaproteobacteria bacterium]
MKKNIGIFLAFSPNDSQSHGISRLLSFMLPPMLQDDAIQILIATPNWFEASTIEFMHTQKINTKKVRLLTTRRMFFLSRAMKFLLRQKTSRTNSLPSKNKRRLLFSIKKYLYNIIVFLSSIMTSVVFYPALTLFRLAKSANRKIQNLLINYRFTRIYIAPLMRPWLHFIRRNIVNIYRKTGKILKSYPASKILLSPLSEFKRSFFVRATYTELRTRELNRLIHIINSRPDISVWFIPALFWPEVKAIKAKKIIAVPDIVSIDFPKFFSDHLSVKTYERVKESVFAADHFICYSDYVKQKHLVENFSVDSKKITIIPHAHVELNQHTHSRQQSIQILSDYQKRELTQNPYLSDFNLSGMRFIFYSSQIRPYKNFMNLIKSYEILLRERFVNVKLIVTGNLNSDPDLYQYILDRRLQFDVLSFYNVSPEVLAALYQLAICAVNPTLFEGGFPFTFTEAYSVGTPSVMSAIPVVTSHVKDENLKQQMLFDPYDLEDMANKIEWAVKNHERLFELQAPLYQTFKQRSWELVAKEYINLLTDFSYVK